MKKRVYIEVTNTLSVGFTTGIQRVTKSLLPFLLEDTRSFDFIPIVWEPGKKSWRRLYKKEQSSLNADRSPPAARKSSKVVRHVWRRLTRIFRRAQLVDFQEGDVLLDMESCWHDPIQRERLLPQLSNKNVHICCIHYDLVPILFPEYAHQNTINRFTSFMQAHGSYSELFICISETSRSNLKKWLKENQPSSNAKLKTIVLGSSMASAKNEVTECSLDTNIGKKFVLAVGTVEPRKNYNVLIDAFNRLIGFDKEINLVIVGKKGWLAEDVSEKLLSHEEYGKRLHWFQMIDDRDLTWLYDNAHIFVFPTLFEGFGLPLVEALARGCVSIVSDTPTLREIGEGYVKFFNPRDSNELFIRIRDLLADTSEYQMISERTAEYLPPTWEDCVNQLEFILNKQYASD